MFLVVPAEMVVELESNVCQWLPVAQTSRQGGHGAARREVGRRGSMRPWRVKCGDESVERFQRGFWTKNSALVSFIEISLRRSKKYWTAGRCRGGQK